MIKMSTSSNRVSGSGVWGMTVDHMVVMLRDPDLPIVLDSIDIMIPAGHNIDIEIPAGHNIDIEVVVE